jgi:hypothetical protein
VKKERPKRIKIIVGLLLAAGLATALGGWVASATVNASPAQSGTEYFWASGFNRKTTSSPTEVVMTGLFTEAGKLVGKGPIDQGRIFDIVFPNGTIVASKWRIARLRFTVNASTCLASGRDSGHVRLESGTGAYKGISGTLSQGGHVYAVLPRLKNGRCNENSNAVPLGVVGMFSGSGTVTISG